MNIKRFVAPDMKQAMQMIRRDLGPDAVILSNKDIPGGVEVLSTTEYDEKIIENKNSTQPAAQQPVVAPEPVKPAAKIAEEVAPKKRTLGIEAYAEQASSTPTAPSSTSPKVEEELRAIRGLLNEQMSALAWNDFKRAKPLHAALIKRMSDLGFCSDIINTIVTLIPETIDINRAWQKTCRALTDAIPFNRNEILNKGGVAALFGPAGSGKTTCIAKLAAQFALKHSPDSVGIISLDNFRIGQNELLSTYAKILNIPFRVVANDAELNSAINGFSEKDLILIDTASLTPNTHQFKEQLARVGKIKMPVKSYFVLPANEQYLALKRTYLSYDAKTFAGCLITKTDQATSLGDVLSLVAIQQLPVNAVTCGQHVPNDLLETNSKKLFQTAANLAIEYKANVCDEALLGLYQQTEQ